MKTIKTAITLMALTLGFTTLQAEVFDRLVLKNGKVVAGYLAGQKPGQCIKFYAEEIKGGSTHRTMIDDDELIPTGHVNSLYDDINMVSAADKLPRTYTFSIGDVTKIERELRPENQTFGIIDVITTRSGEVYEGQVIGQTLGSSIQIWDGRKSNTVYNNNLASQEKRPLDASKDIIEQSPFLDVVVTQRVTYRGLIIMQNYGSEQQSSYLKIQETNGEISRVLISQIVELQREPNPQYSAASTGGSDFVPEPGVIYFNSQAVKSISTEKDDGVFILDEDDTDGTLVLPLENGQLTVVMDDNADNRNTILLPIEQRKVGRKKKFAFDYEDLVDKAVSAETSTSDNGTLRRVYTIQPGTYVLYHRTTGKVNFCEFQ